MSLTQALMKKSTRGKLVSLLLEDSARFDSRQDRGAVAKMWRITQNV